MGENVFHVLWRSIHLDLCSGVWVSSPPTFHEFFSFFIWLNHSNMGLTNTFMIHAQIWKMHWKRALEDFEQIFKFTVYLYSTVKIKIILFVSIFISFPSKTLKKWRISLFFPWFSPLLTFLYYFLLFPPNSQTKPWVRDKLKISSTFLGAHPWRAERILSL